MNTLKTSILILTSAALVAGCGHKKEEPMVLPPEQVLTGNAILAPQSVTVEAHAPAIPVNMAPVPAAEMPSVELSPAASKDKPANKDIQQALKNAGLYSGPVDGNIGPKTKKAIRDFQAKNGLHPDGKVGPRTWKKLSAYLQGGSSEAPEPVAPVSN